MMESIAFSSMSVSGRRAARPARGLLGLWAPMLAVALAAMPCFAQEDFPKLENGLPVNGLVSSDVRFRTYVIEVGAGVERLEVATASSEDVDLFVKYGSPIGDRFREESTVYSQGVTGYEYVELSADGEPPLLPGLYYVDVAVLIEEPPDCPFQLTATWSGDTGGPPPSDEEGVDGVLEDGMCFTVHIAGEKNYATYTIEVPGDVQSLLVRVQGAGEDMDLYARLGAQMGNYVDDPDHTANSKSNDEALCIDGESSPPLQAGTYYIDVAHAESGGSVTAYVSVELNAGRPADFESELTLDEGTLIAPGEAVTVRISRAEQKYATYRVEVPPGMTSLHIWTVGATRDIDLYVKHGSPIANWDDDFNYSAYSARLDEHLTIDARSEPPVQPGLYFIDIVSHVDKDESASVTLLATLNAPPQLDRSQFALPPYPMAGDLTVIERAILSTVEVDSDAGSGSGSCLTPNGHILTNHHVIHDEEEGTTQTESIFIAFTRAFDEVPVQVFEAECLMYDEELDLALLRVVKDIYGRPLPAKLELPHFRLGDSSRLRIGDELDLIGYPAVGGSESRSSVSVTQGIVSGFTKRDGERLWLKTDARINAGNSGGAAIDTRGNLIAIPTREIIEEDDELGYCRPVDLIPQTWRELIR